MSTAGEFYNLAMVTRPLPTNSTFIFPETGKHWGDSKSEVTIAVGVHAVTGSPTSWSVTVEPIFRVLHVGGPGGLSGGGLQFRSPMWAPYDAAMTAKVIAEGTGFAGPGQSVPASGPAIVASSAATPSASTLLKTNSYDDPFGAFYGGSSAVVLVQRTFHHFGPDVGIRLVTSSTGGTTPTFGISVNAHMKG